MAQRSIGGRMTLRQSVGLVLMVSLMLVAGISANAWRSWRISERAVRVALRSAELSLIVGTLERLASEQLIAAEAQRVAPWKEQVARFMPVAKGLFAPGEASAESALFAAELSLADRQFDLLGDAQPERAVDGELLLRQLEALSLRITGLNRAALEQQRLSSIRQLVINLAIGAVLIIAGGVLALFFILRVIRPLRILQGAAAKVAQGELTTVIMPVDRGELAELAAGFNAMTVQLGESRRRLHEHAAHEGGEQRLRELADALPHLMWAAQADGCVDYYNSRWDEVLGSTPSAGALWLGHVHPGDRAMVEVRWTEALRSGRPFDCEFRLGHEGRWRWYAGRLAPFFNQRGRLVRWLGTASDMDERKRFESDLRQTRHRAEVLQQLGLDLAVEMDAQDASQRIAAAAVALTGADYGTLHVQFSRAAGNPWQNAHAGKPSDSQHGILEVLDRVPLAERLPVRCEDLARPMELKAWYHSMDHTVTGSLLAVPVASRLGLTAGWLVCWHSGRGHFSVADEQVLMGVAALAAIALDKVQLLTAERAARRLANQRATALALSNAELEQFAYVASHDMREPVRMIGNFLGLFTRQYGDQLDERGRRYIDTALAASQRMQDLIHNLLEFSRVGVHRGPAEQVSLRTAVDTALATLADVLVAAQAEVVIGDLPQVAYRPTQLIQIIQNLVENAVKFRGEAPPRIAISAERLPDGWRLSVADNGLGIDVEHRQRIFVMFQRLHERSRFEGMGIGLSLCKKIVEGHGGEIGVTANPGGGSCFWFTIPDHGAPAEPTPTVGHGQLGG